MKLTEHLTDELLREISSAVFEIGYKDYNLNVHDQPMIDSLEKLVETSNELRRTLKEISKTEKELNRLVEKSNNLEKVKYQYSSLLDEAYGSHRIRVFLNDMKRKDEESDQDNEHSE